MANRLFEDKERIRLRARCHELLISYRSRRVQRFGYGKRQFAPLLSDQFQAYLQWHRAWEDYIIGVRDGNLPYL